MERMTETIRLVPFVPTEELKGPLEKLPANLKTLVGDVEKFYADTVERVNWLLNEKLNIEAHTASDTLLENESGSVHTNLGATGAITFTLPSSATKGVNYRFAVQAAQELRIDPGTATIRDDVNQTASKYTTANAIGECIHIVADANGDWETISKYGTWTKEA